VEEASANRRVVITLYEAILETAAKDKQAGVLTGREWVRCDG